VNFFYYTEYDVSRMTRIICIPISQVNGMIQNTSEIPRSPMWDRIKKGLTSKGLGNDSNRKVGRNYMGLVSLF